jgi:hypothetical protein
MRSGDGEVLQVFTRILHTGILLLRVVVPNPEFIGG